MPDWKAEVRKRLSGLQLAPARENAIVEEVAQHLDEHYAELLAGGMSEADAYRHVRAELHDGGLLTHGLQRVERSANPEPIVLGTNRRTNMIADLWQDLRFGERMLLKQPGFTLIGVRRTRSALQCRRCSRTRVLTSPARANRNACRGGVFRRSSSPRSALSRMWGATFCRKRISRARLRQRS